MSAFPYDHLIAYGEGGKICGSRDSQVPAVARPTHSPVEGVLRNALRTHIDDELAALFFLHADDGVFNRRVGNGQMKRVSGFGRTLERAFVHVAGFAKAHLDGAAVLKQVSVEKKSQIAVVHPSGEAVYDVMLGIHPPIASDKDRAFLTKTGSEQILTCRQARHQNIRGTGEGAALIDGERRVGGRALREVNVAAAGDDAFRGNVAGA